MFIHIDNPTTATTLTDVEPEDVQPNAIDVRVDKIFRITDTPFVLSDDLKTHREKVQLFPEPNDPSGFWNLQPGSYEVICKNIVSVGENEVGWLVTRSTLNRNGVFITSGLYDSGYEGVIAAAMYVTTGGFIIGHGTRIGQFVTCVAEMVGKYSGSYGLHSSHDQSTYGIAPVTTSGTVN